jgi:hypothetical protein
VPTCKQQQIEKLEFPFCCMVVADERHLLSRAPVVSFLLSQSTSSPVG